MTMTDTADPREALREQVQGVVRTCACCGVRRNSRQVQILPDRVRGTGELLYGVCDECRPANRVGNLAACVARELLNLDPEDPVLAQVAAEVEMFADLPGSTPDRPNMSPWAHVDRGDLATLVTRSRADADRLACPDPAGCVYCGVSHTQPGTSWRPFKSGHVCGSCAARSGMTAPIGAVGTVSSGFVFRNVVAAVLVGYDNGSEIAVPLNLGSQLGILFAHEAGVTKGSRRPWEHLDIAAIRAENDNLLANQSHTAPPWWLNQRGRGRPVGTVTW